MIVELSLPTKELPLFKSACRQLGVDIVPGEIYEDRIAVNCLVSDPYILVLIGSIMAIDGSHNSLKNELGKIIDELDKKVKNHENKEKNNEN